MPASKEDLQSIFESVKSVLEKFTPPMVVTKDQEGNFELSGNKPVPYGSKKKVIPGMYFSSVTIRPKAVSFYFFPMYYKKEFEKLIPTVGKCLKGKTCFTFTKPDQVVKKELDAMLKVGVKAWGKSGYMK